MSVAWQQIQIMQSSEGQVMAKFALPDRGRHLGPWASKTQVDSCIFLYQQLFVLMLRQKRVLRTSPYHTVNKHKMRKNKQGSVRKWIQKKIKYSWGKCLKFYLTLVLRTFEEFKWCISVCSEEGFSLPRRHIEAVSCSRFVSHCYTFSSPRPEKERCTVCDRVSQAKEESYPMHQLWWQIQNTPEQNSYSYN